MVTEENESLIHESGLRINLINSNFVTKLLFIKIKEILLYLYCNTYKVSTYSFFDLFITIHYISRTRIFENVRKNVHTRVYKITPDGRFLRLVTSGFILQRVDIFGGCAPCRRTRPKERGCERGTV